ncbi:TMM82 protein, partial [Jacana jacana]|nr:TMM82 protein [Jacana jacana]
MFSLGSWLPGLSWGWTLLDALLQGLVGACAVSVLCSLLKVYLYIQCVNEPQRQVEKEAIRAQRWVLEPLHMVVLTALLALVGSRVAALVVLEFSLRAISTLLSLRKVRWEGGKPRHGGVEGAVEWCSLCRFAAGGAAGTAAWWGPRIALQPRVGRLVMGGLQRGGNHACPCCLQQPWGLGEAAAWRRPHLRLQLCIPLAALQEGWWGWGGGTRASPQWLPQPCVLAEESRQSTDGQGVYQTVLVRMGGLFILLLTIGRWSDVLHILVSLLGELWCLLRAGVMLEACWRQ